MYVAKQFRILAGALLLVAPAIAQNPVSNTVPDAVILNWDQRWTLTDDGAVTYHTRQVVKLNSDRVYDEFADPRITYDRSQQEIEVIHARVRPQGGDWIELPDYGNVAAAPSGIAGWPTFGNVVQRVLVLSGIAPGCVAEVEYKVFSKAGMHPYLEADLRIDHTHPVAAHTVSVTLPAKKLLRPIVTGLDDDAYEYSFQQDSSGTKTHRWVFAELPATPDEPQALPWQASGVRLAFTIAPNATAWLTAKLDRLFLAADDSELLAKLGRDWTTDATRATDKLAALQQHLSKTFNFITIPPEFTPARPRPASRVINSSYGTEAEAAAVFQALAQAAQVAVRPALLVHDDIWLADAAQEAMIAAIVLLHDGPAGVEVWHPQHGRLYHNAQWAGYRILGMKDGTVEEYAMPAWTDAEASQVRIVGDITIKTDGTYGGELRVGLSGLFFSPGKLRTLDGQKRALQSTLRRVLPNVSIESFTITNKTNVSLAADVVIGSSALPRLFDRYRLAWDAHSPALAKVPIPTMHTKRATPARLAGAFREEIDLRITWPEDWTVDALPTSEIGARGDWGDVRQRVIELPSGVHWQRMARVLWRDLPARWLSEMRAPLNQLQAASARTLLIEP